jgi:hypothetical protein
MAKIDTQLLGIEAGFQNPEVRLGSMWFTNEQMEGAHLRRKKAEDQQHKVWYLSIGETGQQPTATFYGHKLTDVLIKALEWRGMPTKSKRGPRKAAQAAG